jgi:hypothetical protein
MGDNAKALVPQHACFEPTTMYGVTKGLVNYYANIIFTNGVDVRSFHTRLNGYKALRVMERPNMRSHIFYGLIKENRYDVS